MAGWNPNQTFSMPMFNPWVPERLRPWIYLTFALLFQLSGGIYFANMQQMMGATGLMREDIQMVAMCGVVGVNMPFPFLFRYKLRFTNQQLLINAAVIIAVCNILCLYVTWLPGLCAISFVAGFFKLCGTFECFSNIRLWLSPKQDFGIFLPSLYIIILAAMPGSSWLCQQLTIAFDSWQMMHWLMVGLMLLIVLVIYTRTHPWRMMPKPLPLVSLDWLGCLLWALCMLEVIWLFTYGEYYNWWDAGLWRTVLCLLPLTLAITIGRMTHIRHPYIDPYVFEHWRLLPILGMFADGGRARLGIHHYPAVLHLRNYWLCLRMRLYHPVGEGLPQLGNTAPMGIQVHATADRRLCRTAMLSGDDVLLCGAHAQCGTPLAAHRAAHLWLRHLLCHDDALSERPHRVSHLLPRPYRVWLHPQRCGRVDELGRL